MRNAKAITVVILFLVLSGILGWQYLRKNVGRPGVRPAKDAPRELLIKKWAAEPFVELSKSREVKEGIQSLFRNQTSSFVLSETQSNGLSAAIGALIAAYQNGEWDAYQRYRLPPEIQDSVAWDTNLMAQIVRPNLPTRQQVEQAYAMAKKALDLKDLAYLTNDFLAFKLAYESAHMTRLQNDSRPIYCVGCWNAVSFKWARLIVEQNQVDVPNLLQRVMMEDNLGAHTPPSVFHYNPRPAETAKAHGNVTFAEIRFVVRTDGAIKAYPVHAQWYWLPEKSLWLPVAMHIAVLDNHARYWF